MWCVPGMQGVAHAANHAPQCVHGGTYCAPAACAMYAVYIGRSSPFVDQDKIYDNGKIMQGEITANDTLETHGVGMYPGLAQKAPEIQTAFNYAVGAGPFQFGPQGTPNPLMTCQIVKLYIDHNQPILWVDMCQWPSDQSNVPEELYYDSGHCKVIAGYNDSGTPEDCMDDSYYIFDPWPNSGSPYWQAQNLVVDVNDVYLTIVSPENPAGKSSWGLIKNSFDE